MKNYAKLLKEHQIKVTPQRLIITQYLDDNRNHPTAYQIYSDLKKDNPSFSKTTVYNTLETLKNHKLVQVLTISESEQRYEFSSEHHHHFLCNKCGTLMDIEIKCPHLDDMLKGEHQVEEVHGYFKGICSKCLNKKKLKRKK
jgi:Fe2+ or Zn2+ uptake regulation protein